MYIFKSYFALPPFSKTYLITFFFLIYMIFGVFVGGCILKKLNKKGWGGEGSSEGLVKGQDVTFYVLHNFLQTTGKWYSAL